VYLVEPVRHGVDRESTFMNSISVDLSPFYSPPTPVSRYWLDTGLRNNRLKSVHRTAGGGMLTCPPPLTHPTSVKPIPKRGSWLMSSVPTMLITRLDCLHSKESLKSCMVPTPDTALYSIFVSTFVEYGLPLYVLNLGVGEQFVVLSTNLFYYLRRLFREHLYAISPGHALTTTSLSC
jgi:hypothetical protein